MSLKPVAVIWLVIGCHDKIWVMWCLSDFGVTWRDCNVLQNTLFRIDTCNQMCCNVPSISKMSLSCHAKSQCFQCFHVWCYEPYLLFKLGLAYFLFIWSIVFYCVAGRCHLQITRYPLEVPSPKTVVVRLIWVLPNFESTAEHFPEFALVRNKDFSGFGTDVAAPDDNK